jgi:hypothetical protein
MDCLLYTGPHFLPTKKGFNDLLVEAILDYRDEERLRADHHRSRG